MELSTDDMVDVPLSDSPSSSSPVQKTMTIKQATEAGWTSFIPPLSSITSSSSTSLGDKTNQLKSEDAMLQHFFTVAAKISGYCCKSSEHNATLVENQQKFANTILENKHFLFLDTIVSKRCQGMFFSVCRFSN